MIFSKGDFVRYHGGAIVNDRSCLIARDEAFVIEPNEDYDDDVVIEFHGVRFTVSHEDLEWIASR